MILVLPYFVFADGDLTSKDVLDNLGRDSGYNIDNPDTALSNVIGTAIKMFLSLLGIIFIVLMLIGGFYYMIAGGDQAKVDKGLGYIRHGIIGLIIILGSYAIWVLIWRAFIGGME